VTNNPAYVADFRRTFDGWDWGKKTEKPITLEGEKNDWMCRVGSAEKEDAHLRHWKLWKHLSEQRCGAGFQLPAIMHSPELMMIEAHREEGPLRLPSSF